PAPGGGCVSGEIRPHEASLNRLFQRPDQVVMQGARCGFIPVTREERLSGQYGELDQNWPFGATSMPVPVMDFMGCFVPNHSHTIPLDIQAVMAALCEELGWEYRPMGL
ncbi:MAG: hypothetical protein NTW06_03450, partial [Candidatus Falkowbacteria bacterium]|nr:hypothetical protein [Candidatus Falkowbacteria bacterium]